MRPMFTEKASEMHYGKVIATLLARNIVQIPQLQAKYEAETNNVFMFLLARFLIYFNL